MPNELSLARTFFLVSGIINALVAAGWLFYTIIIGAFSCGIGCIFGILPVINVISCILDFVSYSRLNELNRTGTFSSLQTASIFEIVTFLTGNPVSGIFGILNLVNLNKEEVKNFLLERGIY